MYYLLLTGYILGCIVNVLLAIGFMLNVRRRITVGDLTFIIFHAMTSWIGVIAFVMLYLTISDVWDKVIYQKENDYNEFPL